LTLDLVDFETTGACHFRSAMNSIDLERIARLFRDAPTAGLRLTSEHLTSVSDLLGAGGAIGRIAARLIGNSARPVRAIAFDKSPDLNWRLGWHQDRVIAVRDRVQAEGFDAWSIKSGQPHVQPPIEIIARMVTLRIHVDAVDELNAPLQVLAGSHALGLLPDDAIERLSKRAEVVVCLADAGDAWAYSTPIVHASAEQRRPGRRRVLQVDYSADELSGGLEWQLLI
jgi:hypothetical protein